MNVSEFAGKEEDWTKFLTENRGGFLASWEWAAFKSRHGWNTFRLQVTDGETTRLLTAVLEKRLPMGYSFYYSFESPIVRKGDWHDAKNQQAFETLCEYLRKRAKSRKVLFYKVDPHQSEAEFPLDWLTRLGFKDAVEDIQAPVVAHVDLKPDLEGILARMKQRGRRNIRKAEKKGVTVTSGQAAEDLDNFYRLHEATAMRQGITYRDKRYFAEMREDAMVNSDKATFFTGWCGGKAVSSILVTFLGDESIYLYGGADLSEDRDTYASYLVQWTAMQEAKKRGCTFYNMTGISQSDDPDDAWYGLRQFKLAFGAEVVRLVGARDYPYKPLLYNLFSQADRVRRKLAKRSGL